VIALLFCSYQQTGQYTVRVGTISGTRTKVRFFEKSPTAVVSVRYDCWWAELVDILKMEIAGYTLWSDLAIEL